jgi:hypothetical protein
MDCSGYLFTASADRNCRAAIAQKLWRMPIIAAVVDSPGATGCPYTIVWFIVP